MEVHSIYGSLLPAPFLARLRTEFLCLATIFVPLRRRPAEVSMGCAGFTLRKRLYTIVLDEIGFSQRLRKPK